jgi:competence protein ComGC
MQRIKNEKGFTLIEMMIVLLIISVLILIAIPNVTKHSKSIDAKGCAAYLKMAQGQVEAYKMDMKKLPGSITVLSEEGYLPREAQCPDGSELSIDEEGRVSAEGMTDDVGGGGEGA